MVSFLIIFLDGLVKSRRKPSYVIPVPHQVRDRLQPESSILKNLYFSWTPAFAGVTTLARKEKQSANVVIASPLPYLQCQKHVKDNNLTPDFCFFDF